MGQKGTPKKEGNPHEWPDWEGRPRWAWAFLNALATSPNVTRAAKAAHITRQKTYERRAEDKVLARCWKEALDESIEVLEAEVHRRAFEGDEQTVYRDGKPVGVVCKYSDLLAIFLLKAHRPERYRDRHEVAVKGHLGVEISFPDRAGREAAKETAKQVGELLSEPDDSHKP